MNHFGSFGGLDSTKKSFDLEYPYFNFDSEHMISLASDEALELSSCAEEMNSTTKNI